MKAVQEMPLVTADIVEIRRAYRFEQSDLRIRQRIHGEVVTILALTRRAFEKRFWQRIRAEIRKPGGIRRSTRTARGILTRRLGSQSVHDERFISEPPTVAHYGPLVSVVVPVFNQGRLLLRAIESVRNQSLNSWELILWDDGSTDFETREVLLEIVNQRDTRIRLSRDENRGVVWARNSGLRLANGKYVVFLDPDDRIFPTYLEKASLILESSPGFDICAPWVRLVDHPTEVTWKPESLNWPEIATYNQLPVSSMIRRETLVQIGGFRQEMALGWEDWDLWIRLAAIGSKSITLNEELFEYTHSEDSGREATSARKHEVELRSELDRVSRRVSFGSVGTLPQTSVRELLGSMKHGWKFQRGNAIVFFIPWLLKGGGADAFIVDLATGLEQAGYQCFFILTETELPDNAVDGYSQIADITPYAYRLNDFLHRSDWSAFVDELLEELGEPTLICMGSRFLYDHASSRMKQGNWSQRAIDILFNPIGHLPRHSEVQKGFTDVVFAYSALEEHAIRTRSTSGRSHVIPVGIADRKKTKIHRNSTITIGWLGRFSDEKRPDWFLELAKEIEEPIEFLMAGTGPLLEECQFKSRNIGNLRLLGFVEETETFFEEIDVLVITSEIEGISVTAMEAISAGVPVISTDVGGMSDLVANGCNGFLVSPNDPQELFSRIRHLIENEDDLREITEYVTERGLPKEFQKPSMINAYVNLIRNTRNVT